ncbi:MAG: hypothetical protein GY810_31110 [Aureispira sp.]|nr:hypothetical protein [Aureispira sp.]
MHKQRLIMTVCAAIGIIATFLPWASVMGLMTVKGIDGADGYLNIILFGGALALALLGDRNVPQGGGMMYGALTCFALAGLLGVYKVVSLMGESMVTTGFGLYLIAIAGVAGAVVAFIMKGDGAETV